jgi:hypothetical protein
MSSRASDPDLVEAYLVALDEYCDSPTALLLEYVLALDEKRPRMSQEDVLNHAARYATWLVSRQAAVWAPHPKDVQPEPAIVSRGSPQNA